MPEVYVVRAEFGRYTEDFLEGGYLAGNKLYFDISNSNLNVNTAARLAMKLYNPQRV
jgi:hypothetical protein